jgi:hypothetical protein
MQMVNARSATASRVAGADRNFRTGEKAGGDSISIALAKNEFRMSGELTNN